MPESKQAAPRTDQERDDARETFRAYLKRPNAVNRGAHQLALDAYRDAYLAEFSDPTEGPAETKVSGLRFAG